MRVFVNSRDGKVRRDVTNCKRKERQSDKNKLRRRRRTGEAHERTIAPLRAYDGDDRLDQTESQRQYQCKVTELRNHLGGLPELFWSPSCQRPVFFNASTTSRGI